MNGINVNLWAMRSGLEDAAYNYKLEAYYGRKI